MSGNQTITIGHALASARAVIRAASVLGLLFLMAACAEDSSPAPSGDVTRTGDKADWGIPEDARDGQTLIAFGNEVEPCKLLKLNHRPGLYWVYEGGNRYWRALRDADAWEFDGTDVVIPSYNGPTGNDMGQIIPTIRHPTAELHLQLADAAWNYCGPTGCGLDDDGYPIEADPGYGPNPWTVCATDPQEGGCPEDGWLYVQLELRQFDRELTNEQALSIGTGSDTNRAAGGDGVIVGRALVLSKRSAREWAPEEHAEANLEPVQQSHIREAAFAVFSIGADGGTATCFKQAHPNPPSNASGNYLQEAVERVTNDPGFGTNPSAYAEYGDGDAGGCYFLDLRAPSESETYCF